MSVNITNTCFIYHSKFIQALSKFRTTVDVEASTTIRPDISTL